MIPFEAAQRVRAQLDAVAKLRPVDRAADTSDFLAARDAIERGLEEIAKSLEAAGRGRNEPPSELIDRVFGPKKPSPRRRLRQVGDVHYDERGRASVLLRPVG